MHLKTPHILAMSETWPRSIDCDALIFYNSKYLVFRCDRQSGQKRGGGVALLVHKTLSFTGSEICSVECGCELLCVDLLCNNFAFRVIVVYRPPTCSSKETQLVFEVLSS